MKWPLSKEFLSIAVCFLAMLKASAQIPDYAELVDPMVGVASGRGSCVPGPCLPHSSIYPSPDTLDGGPAGYLPSRERHKHNGYVATAFIQGKEYRVGQGGDEVDNIIADAYVKGIKGVNWADAYEVQRFNAESARTKDYRERGYVSVEGKHDYCDRMKSGSGTIAFAYNDFCVSEVARGLGKTQEAERYLQRSKNWQNVWDTNLEDSGFTGFIRSRHQDGRFTDTPARKGYNTDFYEGTCWIYSYVLPHDLPGMIEKMGGNNRFIERLCFALENKLVDFSNEPSFMTIWWFDAVNRPDPTCLAMG